ncbi:hypothetical protein BDR03DRAFT_661523 [Suillus americanus]|nr:hypothetical protein BDR03DRAFT_661523 [Suillus americanus]
MNSGAEKIRSDNRSYCSASGVFLGPTSFGRVTPRAIRLISGINCATERSVAACSELLRFPDGDHSGYTPYAMGPLTIP